MLYLIKWLIKKVIKMAASNLQLVSQKESGWGGLEGKRENFKLQNFSANATINKEIIYEFPLLVS